jgi:hypothetical protein
MRRSPTFDNRGVLVAAVGALVLAWNIGTATQSNAAGAPGTPSFLQAGRCYRFTFSVEGAPTWKVLEVLDSGWIKAEVDAGSASARREPAWVNSAQLVSVRETRCSD